MKRAAALGWPLLGTLVLALELSPPRTMFWAWFGWLEWMLLAPLVVLLTQRARWRVHLVAPFGFSFLHSSIYFAARGEPFLSAYREKWLLHLTLDLLVYSATVLAVHAMRYLQRLEERAVLARDLAQAELDALRLQLPADVIDEQLREIEEAEPGEAERRILRFAAELRGRLQRSAGFQPAGPPASCRPPGRRRTGRLEAGAPLLLAFGAAGATLPISLSGDRMIDFLLLLVSALATTVYLRHKRTRDVAELDARLLRTRVRLLRLQLNPHFLFNALNSIAALLEDDAPAARTMAARLRQFVARVLATSDRAEVSLREELELLTTYVAIENVRFGDKLALDVDADERAREAMVPSFVLQPLVENAVRHGLQPSRGGRVSVTAAVESGALRLQVFDDGKARGDRTLREGIGLSNTRSRLHHLYKDGYSLDFRRGAEGFRTVLSIPFRRQEAS